MDAVGYGDCARALGLGVGLGCFGAGLDEMAHAASPNAPLKASLATHAIAIGLIGASYGLVKGIQQTTMGALAANPWLSVTAEVLTGTFARATLIASIDPNRGGMKKLIDRISTTGLALASSVAFTAIDSVVVNLTAQVAYPIGNILG